MSGPRKYLKLAAKISRLKIDDRCFYLGAVAIRGDDVMVSAYNGASKEPCHQHHCEARLVRKLDANAVVYLARTTANGEWANSKPCNYCENILRKNRVKKIYYTIGPKEWACLVF